ncbi:MAG: Nramp family divalent metal transporter [Ktedonobacterales bacterium]|nr:Nramp family divalent metal transporter [Ktedonobacterales bacterium]
MAPEPAIDASPVPAVPPVTPRLPRGFPVPTKRVQRWLRILGPGLITGAADDDPSGIGTYSQVGAAFGTGQLWLALYLLPLAIAVQEMCGRIGLVTGAGIAGVVRKHYNRPLLYGAVALLVIANTINIGADLGAMAASVQVLLPAANTLLLLIGFTVLIVVLEVFIPYKYYARVLKILVLSLLSYAVTAFLIRPDWLTLLRVTVVPNIELSPAFLALVVAVIGTTISPYLFFWQASEEVEERLLHHPHHLDHTPAKQASSLKKWLKNLRIDTAIGMTVSVTTFWFIVMTTGLTLHKQGITTVATPDQAAKALVPLVQGFPHSGELAGGIFALGIIGTGLLAIPVLSGSAAYGVSETFGWREGLSQPVGRARSFYAVIAVATIIGLLLNLLHINPIQALVYSAVINGILAVPLLALIMRIANDKNVMGEFTNGRLSNALGGLTTFAMGLAAIVTLVALFWH